MSKHLPVIISRGIGKEGKGYRVTIMSLFARLGFGWDRTVVPQGRRFTLERAVFRYKHMLSQFVYDASYLEGNPFTYPEVKTLMDGVTVGGHRLSDQQQVLNLADAARELFELVRQNRFVLDKKTFDHLHALVAREEALEWGNFRGEGAETHLTPHVLLGRDDPYQPLPTRPGAPELNRVFREGCTSLENLVGDPLERGMAFFLFGALQQFYFDGNKRTSRFMMNGILMSNGMDAISIPAREAQAFNEMMVRFYQTRNATEMMAFLVSCQPGNAPGPSRDNAGEGHIPDNEPDPSPPTPSLGPRM